MRHAWLTKELAKLTSNEGLGEGSREGTGVGGNDGSGVGCLVRRQK